MHNYAGSGLWVPNVPVVDDGDAPTAADLAAADIANADRSSYNKAQTDGLIGGTVGFQAWPLLDPAYVGPGIFRSQPLDYMTSDGVALTRKTIGVSGNYSSALTTASHTSGSGFVTFPLILPDGVLLTSANIETIGGGTANTPSTLASYKVVRQPRRNNSASSAQDMSGLISDAHSYGGGGNWKTAIDVTTISVVSYGTIDNQNYEYILVAFWPVDASGSFVSFCSIYTIHTAHTLAAV